MPDQLNRSGESKLVFKRNGSVVWKWVSGSMGIVISAIALWYVFSRINNWHEVRESMSTAHYSWIWLPAIIYMVEYWIRSYRWAKILRVVGSISSLRLLPVLFLGFFVNAILPLRAGEFARAASAARRLNGSMSAVLGTVTAERALDILALVIVACCAVSFYPMLMSKGTIISWGVLSVVLWLGLYFISLYPEKLYSVFRGKWIFVGEIIKKYCVGLSGLGKPSSLVFLIFLSVLIWGIDAYVIKIMAQIFRIYITFPQSLAVLTCLAIGVAVPSAPGALGTYEAAGVFVMVNLLGFDHSSSFAFILCLHLFQMLMVSIFGAPTLYFEVRQMGRGVFRQSA